MANLGQKNATQLFTIVVGAPQTLEAAQFSIPYPLTILANPDTDNSGTLLVQYRISPNGAWIDWPAGTVLTETVRLLTGPVEALKFTALVADGTVEIAQ
jgi:hypothetical protein